MKLKVLDLFSGIGGFSLGLERTGGFKTVAFCEIEKFPRKVLNKHWSNVPIYEDVRNVTAEKLRTDGIIPDVITGGFPCQDISVAGNQKGIGEGTRSGLWSECARLLGDIRPRYAIFENVTALLSGDNGRWFEQVLWDISKVGYDAEWHCIPASELGAHHQRDRVWIVAYPNSLRKQTGYSEIPEKNGEIQQRDNDAEPSYPGNDSEILADTTSYDDRKQDGQINSRRENVGRREAEIWLKPAGCSQAVPYSKSKRVQGFWSSGKQESLAHEIKKLLMRCREGGGYAYWEAEPELGRVANGIPDRAHRLKGLGNAVVPQIPELIGRAILEAENGN